MDHLNNDILVNNESNIEETEKDSGMKIENGPDVPPEEQKRLVKEIYSDKLKNCGLYYILCNKWWKSWKQYVGFDGEESSGVPPGMIINKHLLLDPEQKIIKKSVSEFSDIVYIQEDVWKLLKSWYGCDYEISRVASVDSSDNVIIQLHPLTLKVVKSSDEETVHEVRVFSKRCTVRDFLRVMGPKMGFDPNEVRLWDYYQKKYYSLLKEKRFLSNCNLMENQLVLVEEKDENGEFPQHRGYSSSIDLEPTEPGKTGIQNIGNTCFMNSAIQCLSAIPPLTDFFLSQKYKDDINEVNPLGMQGKVAKAFAQVLEKLWSPNTSVIDISDFKRVIEKFSPQFSGYQQHDSHELVAFLLDGLHEDLNRIKDKPYIEEEELNKEDKELAKIAWDNYLARNNSIIVDYFQGLLKSRLVCPTCNKISIKFDPFMYLTLPLPMENKRLLNVTVCFLDERRPPTRYCIEVDKFGKAQNIVDALSEICEVPAERLKLTEVWNCKFQKIFKEDDLISEIGTHDDLFAFEVLGEADSINLKVVLGKKSSKYHNFVSNFGVPFILSVKKNPTPRELYEAIIKKVKILFFDDVEIPELAETIEEEKEEVQENIENSDTEDEDDIDDAEIDIYRQKEINTNAIASFCKSDNPPDLLRMPLDEPIPFELDEAYNYWFTFSESNYKKYYDKRKDDSIIEKHESVSMSKKSIHKPVSIYDCLKLFSTEEILSEEDTWYCNRCKDHKQASKKFDIWKLPRILVVHLKRFSYHSKHFKDKIPTLVEFPLENLDLSEYVMDDEGVEPIYDLIAVSNHYGGMGGGHYTAYALHRNDNKWYQFDDRSVHEVTDVSEICSKAAYLLIYKRRDVESKEFVYQPPSAESEEEEPELTPGLLDE